MQVNILEAKNRLSQLVKAAQAGEDVVIANRGVPVARIVSARSHSTDDGTPGAAHIVDWLKIHPLPAHARRSREAIDLAIVQERSGWD